LAAVSRPIYRHFRSRMEIGASAQVLGDGCSMPESDASRHMITACARLQPSGWPAVSRAPLQRRAQKNADRFGNLGGETRGNIRIDENTGSLAARRERPFLRLS